MNVLRMSGLAAACFIIFLAGCARPPFTNYEGLTYSDQQVAILKPEFGTYGSVRRIWREGDTPPIYDYELSQVSPREFKLTPGQYTITYVAYAYNIPHVVRRDTVELKAGHTYRVIEDHCYLTSVGGTCMRHKPYTQTIWIEDKATGEVLAGEKWDCDFCTGDIQRP